MQYMLYDIDEENSLIVGEVSLDLSAGNYLKALENAVYDNPVLLDDYRRVRVMVDSRHFVLLPPQFGDEDDARETFEATFPTMQGDFSLCRLQRCNMHIGFEMPQGTIAFLNRTFNMPPIFHHLYPLCEHYKFHDEKRGVACMHLNLHEESIDVLVVHGRRLLMANTFACRSSLDAVYYALNAWKSLNLDVQKDQLLLTGTKALRDSVTPTLRQYICYVMPAIFPAAALKIGQDAVKAPLELILLALCE